MSRGIIEQLFEFTARWMLSIDAQDRLAALPRNLQDLAIGQFEQVGGVVEGLDQSEKFVTFASGLLTTFGDASHNGAAKRPASGIADAASQQKIARWESGPGVAWQADSSWDAAAPERLQHFIQQWGLNSDSVNRIQRLSPSALEVVLSEFHPADLPPGSDCNGKFISFASKVNSKHMREHMGDKGWSKGADKGWSKGADTGWSKGADKGWGAWSPPSAGSWAPPVAAWGASGKGSAKAGKSQLGKQSFAPIDTSQIQAFIDKWNLNQDSVDKIQKLSPAALQVVLAQFSPKGESLDWNGKLIVFASHVERGQQSDPVAAFSSQWGLNEDAQGKLYRLAAEDPSSLQAVVSGFSPKVQLDDYSGMLIGFAVSVQRRMRQEAAVTSVLY